AALECGKTIRAVDLPDAGPDDSDVAAPIIDERGDILGVVALRGVPADALRAAPTNDLGLVARWCSRPLGAARAARQAAVAAHPAREATGAHADGDRPQTRILH